MRSGWSISSHRKLAATAPQEEDMTARKPAGSDHPVGANGNGKTARRSYLAGIGASGALLAGAVVTFVFLVGTVSFEVRPEASERDSGTESLGVAELSGPGGGGASPEAATLGEAVTPLASSVPAVEVPSKPKAQPGLKGGGGNGGGDGGSDGGGAPVTPSPVEGGDGGIADDPGDGGGSNGGNNPPSDRPRRPNGGNGGNGNGNGGGGTTSALPTVPGGGSNAPSDRPSGGGGRGR
jgi:hypothetical protein